MKISLITTCFNEVDSIERFLMSVSEQTKLPNEFIIVDAGSTDGTIKIIENFQKKYRWIKLVIEKNVSRGAGRNLAIEKSENDIITVTDAGCLLNENWLKNIIDAFDNKTDVVVGYYEPYYENDFQYFCGKLLVPKNITETVRISSRSIAFRKIVWKKTGGYEEGVDVGEDTLFHWKMIKNKFNIKFAKDAIVYWMMPKSSKELFKKFYKYGAGYWQTIKLKEFRKFLLLIFGSYFYFSLIVLTLLFSKFLIVEILLLILLITLVSIGIKGVFDTKRIKGILYIPYLFLLKNLSFIMGFTFGKIFT